MKLQHKSFRIIHFGTDFILHILLLVVAVDFVYDMNKIFCYNLRLMNIGKSGLLRFQMPYEKGRFQEIGSRLFVCWCNYFVEDIKRDIPLNHRGCKDVCLWNVFPVGQFVPYAT